MQNKWCRRKVLLNAIRPSSIQSKDTSVCFFMSSLEIDPPLIWHNRITWLTNFTCPAWTKEKSHETIHKVHSNSLEKHQPRKPRNEGSSTTYFINNDNAASMPLLWNSRSSNALLASIRTCHIALVSLNGFTSSTIRSCIIAPVNCTWATQNIQKKSEWGPDNTYKRNKFGEFQSNLCQRPNAADSQDPIVTWHQPVTSHFHRQKISYRIIQNNSRSNIMN